MGDMDNKIAITNILTKMEHVDSYDGLLEIANLISDAGLWSKVWLNKCDTCEQDDFGLCMIDEDDTAFPFCISQLNKLLTAELNKN